MNEMENNIHEKQQIDCTKSEEKHQTEKLNTIVLMCEGTTFDSNLNENKEQHCCLNETKKKSVKTCIYCELRNVER